MATYYVIKSKIPLTITFEVIEWSDRKFKKWSKEAERKVKEGMENPLLTLEDDYDEAFKMSMQDPEKCYYVVVDENGEIMEQIWRGEIE